MVLLKESLAVSYNVDVQHKHDYTVYVSGYVQNVVYNIHDQLLVFNVYHLWQNVCLLENVQHGYKIGMLKTRKKKKKKKVREEKTVPSAKSINESARAHITTVLYAV